jgi:Transposase DDE domain group 1
LIYCGGPLIDAITVGGDRVFDIEALAAAPLFEHLAGGVVPSLDTIYRDLCRFDESALERLEELMAEHGLYKIRGSKPAFVHLDIDSTVTPLFGDQEGAAVGPTPRYHPVLARLSETGTFVGARLRPGDTGFGGAEAACGGVGRWGEKSRLSRRRTPPHGTRGRLRGLRGFIRACNFVAAWDSGVGYPQRHSTRDGRHAIQKTDDGWSGLRLLAVIDVRFTRGHRAASCKESEIMTATQEMRRSCSIVMSIGWVTIAAIGGITSYGCTSETDPLSNPDADSDAVVLPAGKVLTSDITLPSGAQTTCEYPWTVRVLAYHPDPVVPRRMYFGSCVTPSGKQRMYVSLTKQVGGNAQGRIIVTEVDSSGALVASGESNDFNDCKEMNGIAAAPDCSTVAVMCRKPNGASLRGGFDKDLVSDLSNTDWKNWITQPQSGNGDQKNDEMWLLEWRGAPAAITAKPSSLVVNKAIGGWEYGNQYLLYGSDGTYGLSMKATVFGPDKQTLHQGDTFMVINRASHTIDTSRGWLWACGEGHTLFNHPAYNAVGHQDGHKYMAICGTDLSKRMPAAGGGIWAHVENESSTEIRAVHDEGQITIKGGPTSLVPRSDGGFLGVFVASQTEGADGATAIGMVRLDAHGVVEKGTVTWVVAKKNVYLSYPQLADLGNGRYLLGWGEMYDTTKPFVDQTQRIPTSYHLKEIGPYGGTRAAEITLSGTGWGEQDQMVSLGKGRVGWAYIPKPAYDTTTKVPACASPALRLATYTSSQ